MKESDRGYGNIASVNNQEHSQPIRDAATRRWRYIRRKSGAYSLAGICGLISLIAFIIAGLSVLALLASLLFYDCDEEPCLTNWQLVAYYAPWTAGGLILGVVAFVGCRKAKFRGDRVAYVPPVREQIAVLPADEVLLRGSDHPAAAPEELLRAAQQVTETASEELLRAGSRSV